MKKLLFLTFIIFLTSAVLAQIKYVPTDYEIIQHAINDSEDGDTNIIEPGVYHQQINFKGKAITVASRFLLEPDTSYISNTIIDGTFLPEKDSSSLVYFNSDEDSTSVLTGLTLQNGKGTYVYVESEDASFVCGGAIIIDFGGATITNNIIKNNKSIISDGNPYTWNGGWGGAIDCYGTLKGKTVIIADNTIMNNFNKSANQAMGGGIEVMYTYGKVIISGNRIIGNRVESVKSGYGGGIAILGVSNSSDIIIENN
jgi:hypothetical protein